ncbi:Maf-like protein [Rhodopseudomonas palustris HaA2]|uniref:Nucleoside triphosphate pyrophosphatase n=1 Tax=Rhodopseudomonas palustris (strain HaA2) TaxID=316058 RepID=NTPP_RHOP2|nr:Maf family protein [Rhodopseudomonas palustris]Q2J353.1 RecName: Full=Nucleoside triphosphate pyrophosphatase; AltName: Full=Nucleotide pyrophosphatase; Short=Nucleotide PPase [Rhodopseudomonas palustris HaA2]ABD05107.1 Maf-like protein [Rhodopseudomonas palustris HaA2]
MTLWLGPGPLVLASQSRARQALLSNAGIPFDAIPADIDERGIAKASGLSAPGEIAALLAQEKAAFVSNHHPGRLVLGADQTLALGARGFNKPADRNEAAKQLRELAGRRHELHAAIALVRNGVTLFADVSIARMTMRPLNDEEIAAYLDLAGDKATSSVGGYQVEGLGVHLFDGIHGDHFTILGLPLLPLLGFLRSQKLLAF